MKNCSQAYVSGLRRRRAASGRLRQLECKCVDPWTCRHYDDHDPGSDAQVDGYIATAQLLLGLGYTPSPNIPAMRAMWRRGGEVQRLAYRIAELWQVSA
jgi:hypothetical protein